jgi:nitronate monooxygenase
VEGARAAKKAGADFIVAQGTEAAGGIADGRGLAALMLGAQGVLMSTPFYAATELLGYWLAKEHLVAAKDEDTRRTRVFDVVRCHEWPEPYTGRALHNRFLERWEGREDALAAGLDAEGWAFQEAVSKGDFETAMV